MTNIKFTTDNKELNRQIDLAKKKFNHTALIPVVTINKLSAKSKKCFYGFHFEQKRSGVKVGDIQQLEDGSVRRIEYVFDQNQSKEDYSYVIELLAKEKYLLHRALNNWEAGIYPKAKAKRDNRLKQVTNAINLLAK